MKQFLPNDYKFNDKQKEVLNLRIAEKSKYDNEPGLEVNLNKTNDEFLNSYIGVERIVPHDQIHELVKMGPEPLYKKLQTDPNRTWCPESKFLELTPEERLNDVREEAMVLALERYILPERINDSQEAYTKALSKICTTITKGYFRDFAINNWNSLKQCPKDLVRMGIAILTKSKNGNIYYSAKERILKHSLDPKLLDDFQLKRNGNLSKFEFKTFDISVLNKFTSERHIKKWIFNIRVFLNNTKLCEARFTASTKQSFDSESNLITNPPSSNYNLDKFTDKIDLLKSWEDCAKVIRCIYPDCLHLGAGGHELFCGNSKKKFWNIFRNIE
jgi:hypothetical protein